MIKSELIERIRQQLPHLSERDISLAVNSLLEQMSEALTKNQRIEIRGFGSFSLRYRPPRLAHNPKTGQKLMTKPKYAVHFKPGKDLKERVDENKHLPIIEAKDDD